MPDRIVRANILNSERVNALGWPEEVFYRRLINVVDDFGRYDARLAVLRAALYPLILDKVREADISRWIAACEKAGLIVLYDVSGKPYLELLNLGDRRRAKYSKFPPPPDQGGGQTPASDNICRQVSADDDTRRQMRPNANANSNAHAQSESAPAADAATDPPGFARFWSAWPSHDRKRGRKPCLNLWKKHGLETKADTVLAGLDRWKRSEAWARKGGEFIPLPMTWLNAEDWEAQPEHAKAAADANGFVRKELTPDVMRAELEMSDEEIKQLEAM